MSEILGRFDVVAGGFAARVRAVEPSQWRNPSPCDGWTALDVVVHVAQWIPAYFNNAAGLALPTGESAGDDPVGAWEALHDALRNALADPVTSQHAFDGPPGRMSVEAAIDMIVTGDLLIHTWDIARAAGLDATLDETEAERALAASEPFDEMLRTSGHYGPRVHVDAEADVTSRLVAFMGRDPSARRV